MDYQRLNELIDEIDDLGEGLLAGTVKWNQYWSATRSALDGFKEARYPTREEKNDAWAKLQETISDIKTRREDQSHELRQEVLDRLDELSLPDSLSCSIGDLGRGVFAAMMPVPHGRQETTYQILMKMVSDEYYAIRGDFKRRQWMCSKSDSDDVWAKLHEKKEEIDDAWKRLKSEDLEARIERLKKAMESKGEYIERQRDKIEELTTKYHETRSDSYGERLQQWIEDARERLEAAESQVEDMERKLSSLEDQLYSL